MKEDRRRPESTTVESYKELNGVGAERMKGIRLPLMDKQPTGYGKAEHQGGPRNP